MEPVKILGKWYIFSEHFGGNLNVGTGTWHEDHEDATQFISEQDAWDKIAELATKSS